MKKPSKDGAYNEKNEPHSYATRQLIAQTAGCDSFFI